MPVPGRPAVVLSLLVAAAATLSDAGAQSTPGSGTMPEVRFMTVDPGHFHAGLVQKEMYPGVAETAFVFAPLGPDLLAHLQRIAAFNRRADRPTRWTLDVYTGPDYFERMLERRPGNVVVLSGRNSLKIDRLVASVGAGFHVLADKPWVLGASDLPKVESALAEADRKGLVAYDIMTERFEVTTILQRALVNDADVFGRIEPGAPDRPGVYMESIHHLMKVVAGAPNIRPAWFFDTREQGEGLNDVGTHLVDLAQWTLFPDQALDYRTEVRVLAAQRWPTPIAPDQFRRVTGEAAFPATLASRIVNGILEYDCNTLVSYTVRGVHVTLNVLWDWEAPEGGGDTHYASYRGTRATVEVRQTKADGYRPEVYVVPARGADAAVVASAVERRVAALQAEWPGVVAERRAGEVRLRIPDRFRVGHEAHFAEVTHHFLSYLARRDRLPAWERPNMLAKYFVTTTGTELSRQGPPRVGPRLAP